SNAIRPSTSMSSSSVKPPLVPPSRRFRPSDRMAPVCLPPVWSAIPGLDVVGRAVLPIGARRGHVDTIRITGARALERVLLAPRILGLLGQVLVGDQIVHAGRAVAVVLHHVLLRRLRDGGDLDLGGLDLPLLDLAGK